MFFGSSLHATIGRMSIDDRFDELASSLGGFYRTWAAYLGLELGLFSRIRTAGTDGITPADLAATAGCQPEPVDVWVRLAHSVDLIDFDGRLARPIDPVMTILLDDDRPEYLGGQFSSTVVSSLDYERLAEFVRTGRTIPERPARFHRAIESVTAQDIAVFFQEALAELPDLAAGLAGGGRVLDVACGGGRWLIAVARRFGDTTLVGVEFEPDSVGRALRHVAEAGLEARISIENRDPVDLPFGPSFDLVSSRTPCTSCPTRSGAPLGVGLCATRRPAGRPRLVPAIDDRGVPLAPRRHAVGDPARRAVPGHADVGPGRLPRAVRGGRDPRAVGHRAAVRRHGLRPDPRRLTEGRRAGPGSEPGPERGRNSR